jgi:3-ketosteroid 9alpha-monooxygenase subunit A
MLTGFPHETIPPGWYQIGWSTDFETGEIRPLRYFGTDLIAYRGKSGAVVVLDAHCRHMGAHLGHGGVIVDDEVECPFHGWRWNQEGMNTYIPDGSPPKRGHGMGVWKVVENSGLVLVWYDHEKSEPNWHVPPIVDTLDNFHSIEPGSRLWNIRVHPQLVAENAIDSAHFSFVHRAGSDPVIHDIQDLGPRLHVSQEIEFGSRKKSTWLTPDGPVTGSLEIDLFGMGLSRTLFSGADEAYTVVAVTPVEDGMSDFRMTNWVPNPEKAPAPDDRARRRFDEQLRQAERDFLIWEHMIYIPKPPLMRTESKPFRAFRTWADRFYAEDESLDSDASAL